MTGMLGWKSWGGLLELSTCTLVAPEVTTKSTPPGVEWTVPGLTTPSRLKVWVPSLARLGHGLVGGQVEVEGGAEALGQQEDQRADQHRADHHVAEAVALARRAVGRAAGWPTRGRRGRRPAGRADGRGGGHGRCRVERPGDRRPPPARRPGSAAGDATPVGRRRGTGC